METVVAAVVAAIPATIASVAAWRSSRRAHTEVQTNHGRRAGEYLEMLPDIHKLLVDHVTDRNAHSNN